MDRRTKFRDTWDYVYLLKLHRFSLKICVLQLKSQPVRLKKHYFFNTTNSFQVNISLNTQQMKVLATLNGQQVDSTPLVI